MPGLRQFGWPRRGLRSRGVFGGGSGPFGGHPTLEANLVGYFAMEADTTWADTLAYFPSFTEVVGDVVLGTGINASCADFDGSSILRQGNDAKWNFVSTGFTINLWINRDVGSELNLLNRTNQTAGWGTGAGAPGTFSWTCWNDGGGTSNVVSGSISDSVWHMVTVGWNQSNKKPWLSIDGAAKTEGTALANTLLDYAGNVSLGQFPGGAYTGLMDEVMIWTKTLSDPEIADLWNGGVGLFY